MNGTVKAETRAILKISFRMGTGMQNEVIEIMQMLRQIGLAGRDEAIKELTKKLARRCMVKNQHPSSTAEKTLQMEITRWSCPKIRLIMFFATKMEKLYSHASPNELEAEPLHNFRLK